MAENGHTTQTLRRKTVKAVDSTKTHPRETFEDAVARLVHEHTLLAVIRETHPGAVEQAQRQLAGKLPDGSVPF
jgi:hypothetical protein